MTTLNKIPVIFNQEEHTYVNSETGEYYQGITETLLHRLSPNKYSNIPESVLQKAAERGTAVHEQLELIESLGIEPTTQEGKNYIRIKEENNLRYLASEYTVSDLKNYATNIDVIYDVEENVVDIADYKTTYKIDHDSVSWQLSICAHFFEQNNPHIKVRKLFCIWLRAENAEIHEEKRHSAEEIEELINADINGLPFIEKEQTETPSDVSDIIANLVFLTGQQKDINAAIDAMKQQLLDLMTKNGADKYETSFASVTRLKSGTRSSFDSKAFKADNPTLYAQYVKTSETGNSIRLNIK